MTGRGYHHGDLRTALVEAGVDAARAGGEAAIGLNKLAAAVGVSASAAYRHFPEGLDDLLVAVGEVGWKRLTERIELRIAQVQRSRDPRVMAARRFRASGEAYVEYVVAEAGLFQVSCRHDHGPFAARPYKLLEGCIDDLVAAGVLAPSRREDAAPAAWAAVHGLAVLLSDGPLRRLDEAQRRRVVARTLAMVGAGL